MVGKFFTSDGSGTFDTPNTAQPVFTQNFASVDFNPPAGTVPGTPSSIDPVIFLTQLQSAALPPWAKVGLPPFTGTLPDRDPASQNGNVLDFLTRNSLAQPYTQNWSLGFQYQLPHEVMLEADYVGAKGSRLLTSTARDMPLPEVSLRRAVASSDSRRENSASIVSSASGG